MKKLKVILSLFLYLFIFAKASAQVINDTQMIQGNHWIYDGLYTLSMENKLTNFLQNSPASVGELKFYLNEIEYEKLSDSGKELYSKIESFLYTQANFFGGTKTDFKNQKLQSISEEFTNNFDVQTFVNLKLNPELYYKSNPDIEWSYNYFYKDNPVTLPILFGFSNYFSIESDFALGKSYTAAKNPWNITNIPYQGGTMETLWPKYAYGSAGVSFDNWGLNLNVGKEGLQLGKTLLGSIIYNKTFETEGYVQLNLYSRPLKYNLDVVQVTKEQYLYLHELDLRPLKWLKVGCVEGTLVNYPFEIRYLNPFMIMHSYAGWSTYGSEDEKNVYKEGHFCAYLGLFFEITPFKNFRMYGMFNQTEIQMGGELKGSGGNVPDGIGGQFGIELNIPAAGNGYWITGLEAVYTSPYLYVKQGMEWSMVSARYDETNPESPVYSWIGSPLGPDCFGVQYKLGYTKYGKWSVEFDYLMTIHGEKNAKYFFEQDKVEYDGKEYYAYYPYAKWALKWLNKIGDDKNDSKNNHGDDDEFKTDARNMWMSGTIEYKNQIALKSELNINPHLAFGTKEVFTYVINNKNKYGKNAFGVELSAFVTIRLFGEKLEAVGM